MNEKLIEEFTKQYFNESYGEDKAVITHFMKKYGGYIDIGLYDTIEDMICALIGAILFIITISINKKKYT